MIRMSIKMRKISEEIVINGPLKDRFISESLKMQSFEFFLCGISVVMMLAL